MGEEVLRWQDGEEMVVVTGDVRGISGGGERGRGGGVGRGW